MFRSLIPIAAALGVTASAAAQSIQWISNFQQGLAQARRSGLPVLLYITGSTRDGGDIKDDQQRAFRDARVRGIAQERFVPVRQAQGSESRRILQQLGGRENASFEIACLTADGKLLGMIGPGQVANAKTLALQMTAMFRKFRTEVFQAELKEKLEEKSTRAGDVIKALKRIEKLLIAEADETVAGLLEREGLSNTVKKQVYDVLAVLSTPRSVKALLKAAATDKVAANALKGCTPAGAEEMLSALDLEKPEELSVVYEAVTRICRIRDKKPRGFWQGKNQGLLRDEIERVAEEVRRSAKRWREKYEAYR